MFVKPVKGQSVPDPARGDVLPEKGRKRRSVRVLVPPGRLLAKSK